MNAHEKDETQNPNMRVRFDDSPVIINEVHGTPLGSAIDRFVDFGTDSNMPPMINFETAGLMRSPRIAAKKEKNIV